MYFEDLKPDLEIGRFFKQFNYMFLHSDEKPRPNTTRISVGFVVDD